MNNLILTGFITAYSGLKEAVSDNYGKYNDLTVWKIDVLDAEEKVIFTCRK